MKQSCQLESRQSCARAGLASRPWAQMPLPALLTAQLLRQPTDQRASVLSIAWSQNSGLVLSSRPGRCWRHSAPRLNPSVSWKVVQGGLDLGSWPSLKATLTSGWRRVLKDGHPYANKAGEPEVSKWFYDSPSHHHSIVLHRERKLRHDAEAMWFLERTWWRRDRHLYFVNEGCSGEKSEDQGPVAGKLRGLVFLCTVRALSHKDDAPSLRCYVCI